MKNPAPPRYIVPPTTPSPVRSPQMDIWAGSPHQQQDGGLCEDVDVTISDGH